MYPNVRAELARKDMTILDLSNETNIRYMTLCNKLNGKSEITVSEAKAIKNALKCEMPIDELFEKETVAG